MVPPGGFSSFHDQYPPARSVAHPEACPPGPAESVRDDVGADGGQGDHRHSATPPKEDQGVLCLCEEPDVLGSRAITGEQEGRERETLERQVRKAQTLRRLAFPPAVEQLDDRAEPPGKEGHAEARPPCGSLAEVPATERPEPALAAPATG